MFQNAEVSRLAYQSDSVLWYMYMYMYTYMNMYMYMYIYMRTYICVHLDGCIGEASY
jgi:hypothetical protein